MKISRRRIQRRVKAIGASPTKQTGQSFFDSSPSSEPMFFAAQAPLPTISRKCESCEQEEKGKVQREASASSSAAPSAVSSYVSTLGAQGSPLPNKTKHFFEPKFKADFSGVRVHDNGQSAAMASSVHAKAFTYKNNIVFNKGQYDPESAQGQHLLAHELTHVVQQNPGISRMEVEKGEEEKLQRKPVKDEDGPMVKFIYVPWYQDFNWDFAHEASKRVAWAIGMAPANYTELLFSPLRPQLLRIHNFISKNIPTLRELKKVRLTLQKFTPHSSCPWRELKNCSFSIISEYEVAAELKKEEERKKQEQEEARQEQLRKERISEIGRKIDTIVPQVNSQLMNWGTGDVFINFKNDQFDLKYFKGESVFWPRMMTAEEISTLRGHLWYAYEHGYLSIFKVDRSSKKEEVDSEAQADAIPQQPVSCAELDDPVAMVECMKDERLRYGRAINEKARQVGATGTAVLEAVNPLDPINLATGMVGGIVVKGVKTGFKLTLATGVVLTKAPRLAYRGGRHAAEISSDLFEAAFNFRRSIGTSQKAYKRNIAVAKVEYPDKSVVYIKSVNQGGKGAHSEEMLVEQLMDINSQKGAKGRVTELFSERVPCSNCTDVIDKFFGQTDVFFLTGKDNIRTRWMDSQNFWSQYGL